MPKLFNMAGGKLVAWYFTFGESGWLLIAEAPDEKTMGAAAIVAIAGGSVTEVKTTLALSSAEAMQTFRAAGDIGPSFKSAGQSESSA